LQDPVDRISASLRDSQMIRLLSIGFLALLLLIPIGMISDLVSERQLRRSQAIDEIASKWGGEQIVTGPALVVPYTVLRSEIGANQQTVVHATTRTAVFLPERLKTRGAIDGEIRRRGIFSLPVYRLRLQVEGEFARPDLAALGLEPDSIAWDRAQLVVGLSDARAIQEETAVRWNDQEVDFLPGTGRFAEAAVGIHAIVDLSKPADRFRFSFPLALNGSAAAWFTPFGKSTEVELASDSGDPSFQGNWLPAERKVGERSFEARWSIPFLGRNYPQAWRSTEIASETIEASRFGVALATPVDPYRMAERSVKYAGLFILLTFATVWLVEILAGLRVHPIQYLMLGGALCLFYLLELSLAEHLGFGLAYALASASVVALVTAYATVALQRISRSLVVASGVAMLYGYLYVLLNNEDSALLIGSIGLFVILAAIMYATRRVDWYAVGRRAPRPDPSHA